MPDQVDNFFQDQIFLWDGKPDCKRLCNKAANIPVNTIPAARSDMRIRNLHNDTVCHIATGRLEDPVQDHGEVHDVTHHASNILLAVTRETKPLVDVFTCPLTSRDIRRIPNPRTCRRIRSSQNYRQINSLNIPTYCVIHSPRRCAASRHS